MASLLGRLQGATARAASRAALTRVVLLAAAMATFAAGQLLAFPTVAGEATLPVVVDGLYLLVPLVAVYFAELLRGDEHVYRPMVASVVALGLYAVTDALGAVVAQPRAFRFVFVDVGLLVATGALLVGLGRWTGSRNERERRLREREAELQRNNERLEEFASVVSHDLRNPLQVADGHLTLIEETGETDRVADVQRALDRMNTIIEDVLALARMGEDTVDPEPVTLEAVATDAWDTVATGEAVLAVEEGTVVADRALLQQVFENLFRNAVEHAGPDVHVRVGPTRGGFYVEDDGPGIPPEDREDVLEAGYTTDEDGTGFGLAIVTRVAEAHGWETAVTDSQIVDVAPDGDGTVAGATDAALDASVGDDDGADRRTDSRGARFEFAGVDRA